LRDKFPKTPVMDRATYEWAWAERSQNNKAGAIRQYEYLLQNFPESALAERSRFELAELTFDAKNFDTVIAQLTESIKTAKEPVVKQQAMYKLAWAYLSKNDADQAADAFEAFAVAFPNADTVATARYQAGECRMRLKEYDAAVQNFAAAVVKAGKTTEVHESALLRLGEAQALMLKWADSVATYRQYQMTYPTGKWLQHARLGAGWAFENQKQYRDAINEYSLVVATKNVDEIAARCQFQIGECLFAQGKYDQAIQEFTRVEVAYRFEEWSARALLEIGRALEAKGDKAGAIARFKELISRFPKNTAALVAKERLDALRASM
jgi:TolA-binding protein